jgi:hypothetical protein
MQVRDLPHQSNGCDCGFFLLSYAEFFCYCPPRQIHLFQSNKRCNRILVDFTCKAPGEWGASLLDGRVSPPPDAPPDAPPAAVVSQRRALRGPECVRDLPAIEHPTFLTKSWFDEEKVLHLRTHLLIELVPKMMDWGLTLLSGTSGDARINGYAKEDIQRGIEVLTPECLDIHGKLEDKCAPL